MKLLGRVSGDLADVEAGVLAGEVGHHQSPVVGVAVGRLYARVPSVGDVSHGQQVGRGEDCVSQPGDLITTTSSTTSSTTTPTPSTTTTSRSSTDGSYRFLLFKKDPTVESDVVPVPPLHPGVVLLLEVSREYSLF